MRRLSAAAAMAAVMAAAICGAAAGCRPTPVAAPAAGVAGSAASAAGTGRESADKLLLGAVAVLDRLEDFDEARGLDLVFERITQWSRAARPDPAEWRPEPLLDTLPADLRAAAAAPPLDAAGFVAPADVVWLRDERWLADVARHARGSAVTDLDVAANLFRWTVRSLAPVADPPWVPAVEADRNSRRWLLPGEILLAGRASPAQRTWIFLELVRHAGLDAALLATVGAEGPPRPWIPAVVCDGEAYLFEPTYGIPVPGPGGKGIATARQAADDPAVLAALSLPDRPYPVQAADVAAMAVLVAADPWSLSRRMAGIAPAVRGLRDVRLTIAPARTAAAVAAALPRGGAGGDVRLWEFPWTTLARRRIDPAALAAAMREDLAPLEFGVPGPPSAERGLARPLFAGRVREFRGDVEDAKTAYLAARPSQDLLAAALKTMSAPEAAVARDVWSRMKEDATYWLGVLTLSEGENEAAADFLDRMTLRAAPDSRWADAARQNLAEALIALGRPAEAAAILRRDESPQRFGSRLRAARLEADPPASRD